MNTADFSYAVCSSRLDPRLRSCFVQEAPDPALHRFLEASVTLRAGRLRTLLQRILSEYLSDYDANGLLNIYSMHLLSTPQAARLLDRPGGGRLLDIGAGSGDITVHLAPLFDHVEVTELSFAMARRLRRRGFRCTRTDVGTDGFPVGDFDVVALLNVLDRCVNPAALLRACSTSMAVGTKMLVSLPLPYRPHAYVGSRTIDPVVPLPIESDSWEDAASSFVVDVLMPSGLDLSCFTRVPYLSAGDSRKPLYVLDAFVGCCIRADRRVGEIPGGRAGQPTTPDSTQCHS